MSTCYVNDTTPPRPRLGKCCYLVPAFHFLPKELPHNELHRTKKYINHHYLPLEVGYLLVKDVKYPLKFSTKQRHTTVCVYVDDVISRNWRWANPITVQKEITCEALESNAVWMAGKNCWCNRCTSVQFHNHTIDQCALVGGVVPLVTVCWMTWTYGQEHKGDDRKKSCNKNVHNQIVLATITRNR